MQFADLLHNHLLTNALVAWAAAQIIKTVIYAVVNKTLDIHRLFGDGGMPSGHSATVTALAVTAAMEYGLGSPAFAVSSIFGIIVMHDAMGVRLEAGKHAKAINELLAMFSSSDSKPEDKLKEFLGHTPLQVCFGALLGLVTALLLH
ncbi:MAG: divergent PAP2 family protein [Oscillibacter sp.]